MWLMLCGAWLRNSMFCETSPVPYCMAQEFAMLYDTLCHICRGAVVSNNVIPTYVISRGAVVRQPLVLISQ